MKYELKVYSLGQTIGQGFNLYFDNFIFLFVVSLITNLPIIFLTFIMQKLVLAADSSSQAMVLGVTVVTVLLSMIIGVFISGIIIQVISKKYLNEKVSSQDYLKKIIPLVFPLIGLAFLQSIGVAAGFILLIVPGILLTLGWAVATQVLVVEKASIVKSLGRSWKLTKGKKGHILGLMLLTVIILFILQVILGTAITLIEINPIITVIANNIAGIVVNPLMSCILVVLYFNLRVEKEGFNIEHLADQFNIIPAQEK